MEERDLLLLELLDPMEVVEAVEAVEPVELLKNWLNSSKTYLCRSQTK